MMENRFMVIGVMGGVGAGKSTILKYIEHNYHCVVFVTDMIAYSIMREDGQCFAEVRDAFSGYDILNTAGNIDSFKVGRIIFKNDEMRLKMNRIVHPKVIKYVLDGCSKSKENGYDFAVVESALLIESGLYQYCDKVLYVTAPEDVRIQRLMHDRGYSKQKCKNIISGQLSEQKFMEYASEVISTGSTYKQTYNDIETIFHKYGIDKKQNTSLTGDGVIDSILGNFV